MLNSHTLDTIKEKKQKGGHYKLVQKSRTNIKGDSDCPIVEINLQNNETVKIEEALWPICQTL